MSKIHEALELSVPLIVLDCETTGLFPKTDRVIQIALVKIMPDGATTHWKTYVNPECRIPPEATEIHHITDEMVAGAPTFEDLIRKHNLLLGFKGCDVAGYNVDCDIDFLTAEFDRCQQPSPFLSARKLDAYQIFRMFNKHSLTAAVKFYLDEEFPEAHDAMEDVRATLRVLEAQLERHAEDLPTNMAEMHRLLFQRDDPRFVDDDRKFYWRFGEAHFNFSKHAGQSLRYIARNEPGFLRWMLRQGDFSPSVLVIVREALEGRFPRRNTE